MPAREIRFENVSFRYPGSDVDVLRDLDLTIRAHEALALVGVNGAGKSTLVKLLGGAYKPTTGRITVDGVDLSELDLKAWQRRIAAIVQDFLRFPLSVTDNVVFGAVERADDEVALAKVARESGIDDVVRGLPDGWDTVLDKTFDGGVDLSGGEWQRIALARALFAVHAGAGVLVLDEPAAALDVRAEAELVERYLELTSGVASLIISHRFSVVRNADRICVLADGRITEDGTHEQLLEKGGTYAAMFRLQAERYVRTSASDEPEALDA
jgi:ATP-binding cassette subfamily B protein